MDDSPLSGSTPLPANMSFYRRMQMNRKQAEEKGYCYTGFYSRSKEAMKAKAAEIRALGNGFKAIVVDIPDSKYSRGGVGTGYSVYVNGRYCMYDNMVHAEKVLKELPAAREYYKKQYEEKMKKLDDREAFNNAIIAKAKDFLGN
jgi:hypothetical protein